MLPVVRVVEILSRLPVDHYGPSVARLKHVTWINKVAGKTGDVFACDRRLCCLGRVGLGQIRQTRLDVLADE